MNRSAPAIWFPTIRTGTGTDVFTERLVDSLTKRGVQAGITWLPLRAEYAPWSVPIPSPPAWANVVHINSWLPARLLPRRLPIVTTIHHAVHHRDASAYKGVARAIYHRFWIAQNERNVLRRSDAIVAVSRYVAESARQALLDAPMHVIYNGVNTSLYQPPATRQTAHNRFRLLYVGSWMARKGVDLLPPIMRQLGDQFELRYTGGAASDVDKANMPSNMRDLGRLQGDAAVITELQQSDALLFPSRSEGHPLVAIEAMACGLPVIGMTGSSVAEAVVDGKTGVICLRNDVPAFVTAIRDLAANPVRLDTMSRSARDLAIERFTEDAMVDAYTEVYVELSKSNECFS